MFNNVAPRLIYYFMRSKTVDDAVSIFSKSLNMLQAVETREANEAQRHLEAVTAAQKEYTKSLAESVRAANVAKKISALLGDDAF